MINYWFTYDELRKFGNEYAAAYAENPTAAAMLAKQLKNKIVSHYINQKEFLENVLPHKVELMKLAAQICHQEHGKYESQRILEIYKLVVDRITENTIMKGEAS